MKIRPFTPSDYPVIIDIHKSLDIAWPERPGTPEAWAEVDKARSPKVKYVRLLAEEAGQAMGFATYRQGPTEYPPKSCYINVEVCPGYQRRGIGSALYDCITKEAGLLNPTALRADAFTNLPNGFTFLLKRGFREVFRETPVQLDLASFDASPFAGLERRLNAEGITIKTLQELESDPACYQNIYELYWSAAEDLPTEGEPLQRTPFDEWLEWGIKDPTVLHDAYFIALDKGKYIGLRELGRYGDGDALLGSLLGVRREYRRRGIGLLLHLKGILYAKEHGYRLLKTCTAVQNTGMQVLFDKFGYTRGPEWQQCQKDL